MDKKEGKTAKEEEIDEQVAQFAKLLENLDEGQVRQLCRTMYLVLNYWKMSCEAVEHELASLALATRDDRVVVRVAKLLVEMRQERKELHDAVGSGGQGSLRTPDGRAIIN